MSETLLIAIYADPAQSGVTAEALRMGMGLSVGERELKLVLVGPAARVLTDEVDDLVDGEMIENHLDIYAEWGTPFHVHTDAVAQYDLDGSPVEVIAVDDHQVARMMASAEQVMVFP